ncbi:Werner syndrome ATP-dependent helicase [Bienertia sinuspersici]
MVAFIKHAISLNDREIFQVKLRNHFINTTLTSSHICVASWIRHTEHIHHFHIRRLIVGLDIEWRPNFSKSDTNRNPVAVLQLCVGHRCLVFHIHYADVIPEELRGFLGNERYTFVGVGVGSDAMMLYEDFGLLVRNTVELPSLASVRLNDPQLKYKGLLALGKEVLGLKFNKSKKITLSNWSQPYLTPQQVCYATIDAFISFEIGKCLRAAHFQSFL